MKIALYQGLSFTSKAIRFLTRSPYSHAAFLFDDSAAEAARKVGFLYGHAGAVIEAWEPGGVRAVRSLGDGHTAGTPVHVFKLRQGLSRDQETALILFLREQLGKKYDFWNVLRFVTKHPSAKSDRWFCSELVFEALEKVGAKLFENSIGSEVPPDWIARSPLLEFEASLLAEPFKEN